MHIIRPLLESHLHQLGEIFNICCQIWAILILPYRQQTQNNTIKLETGLTFLGVGHFSSLIYIGIQLNYPTTQGTLAYKKKYYTLISDFISIKWI